MSSFNRLERIVKSWVGRARRNVYYDFDDALAILNELGLQLTPEALAFMTSTDVIMQEFLDCIYAAEDAIGRDLILDHKEINPLYEPMVYEEDGWIIFTLMHRAKEKVFAEIPMPGAKARTVVQEKQPNVHPPKEKTETREIEIDYSDENESKPEPTKEGGEVRDIEIGFDDD